MFANLINHKIVNMVLMEDSTSIENNSKMCSNGRNEGPLAGVVNESSKSSLCDDNDKCEEQVRDHLVANDEAIEIPAGNDDRVDRFGKDGTYP